MTTVPRGKAASAAAVALAARVLIASANAQVENPDLNGRELFVSTPIAQKRILDVTSWYSIGKTSSVTDLGGFSGLGIEYVRDLERALNFRCSSFFEYEEDDVKYKGFTGLTRYFNDCADNGDSAECKCDIAISGFAMTAERLPRVDFPAPYAFDSFSAVQRLDGFRNANSGASTLLLAPFDFSVWGGVVSIVITHVIVTVLDMEFLPPGEDKIAPRGLSAFQLVRYTLLKTRSLRKVRYALFDAIYSMLLTTAAQVVNRLRGRSAPTRQRVLTLIAQFAGLFLILCYEAGLVVQLFVDDPESEFRSIEDVKNCRIDASDMCVPLGGATQDYWKFAVEPARENCRKVSLEDDQPTFVTAGGQFKDPFSAGLSAVAEKKCSYFFALTSTMAVSASNEYCGVLSTVGDPFYPVPISVVLPKDSNVTGPISTATLKFQLADSLQSPIDYGVPRKCNAASAANSLTWRRVAIIFYVTWALHAAMLAYMLIDKRGRRGQQESSQPRASESIASDP